MLSTILPHLRIRLEALRNNDEGQSLVEWALILALVAVVSIFVLQAIGIEVFNVLDASEDGLPDDSAPIGTQPTSPTGF